MGKNSLLGTFSPSPLPLLPDFRLARSALWWCLSTSPLPNPLADVFYIPHPLLLSDWCFPITMDPSLACHASRGQCNINSVRCTNNISQDQYASNHNIQSTRSESIDNLHSDCSPHYAQLQSHPASTNAQKCNGLPSNKTNKRKWDISGALTFHIGHPILT